MKLMIILFLIGHSIFSYSYDLESFDGETLNLIQNNSENQCQSSISFEISGENYNIGKWSFTNINKGPTDWEDNFLFGAERFISTITKDKLSLHLKWQRSIGAKPGWAQPLNWLSKKDIAEVFIDIQNKDRISLKTIFFSEDSKKVQSTSHCIYAL